MVPVQHRLKLRSVPDFFRNAFVVRTPGILWFVGKVSSDTPLIACVVPKSIAKKAVWRNQTKRRVSAGISQAMASLPNTRIVARVTQYPLPKTVLYDAVSTFCNHYRSGLSKSSTGR